MRKVLLIILDGWGHSDFKESPTPGNAIEFASVPHFRELYDHCPRTRLACSGVDVGLPADQMGNSEVGHLNLGGGRIVPQDLARIDQAIAEECLLITWVSRFSSQGLKAERGSSSHRWPALGRRGP
ncbi:MAG: hypothetical protein CM1200mP14_09940 [Gammaproteobacteria bacterium]|nr:MAG: hypothetical protein CM1200mP14_09940 [Gammaproteobacteria bacterium]